MIVAVYSVKGGAGRTTIAVNIAAAIGQKHRGDCVVLDLSLPYNHAALVANLVPTSCMALCDRAEQGTFEAALLGAVLHHHTGMVVLPSALRIEQSELVTPQLVQRSLDVLEQTFEYVLVDLGVAMSELALGVLERADRILVIVTPELPALKDTTDLLRIFENVLDVPLARVSLVLNHPRPQTMVTGADAKRTLKREVEIEIAYDGPRFDRAAVTGEVLVAAEPSSAAAKSIRRLANLLTDEHKSRIAKRA